MNTVELAESATDQTAEVWHQRLGHLNNNSADQLAKKEMVTGMNCTTSLHAENKCEGCVLGNHIEIHFLSKVIIERQDHMR